MNKFFSLLNFLCLVQVLHAQSVYTGLGARTEAMGNASAALTDGWSLFHNPAGMAWVQHPAVICTYAAYPLLEGADRLGAGTLFSLPVGTAGFTVFRFGDALYSESMISAAFANRLGLAGLGGRINYLQYRAEGFGTRGVFTLDLGGIAEITPQLRIGAGIRNINRPKLNNDGDRTPVIMQAGISFRPTEKFTLVTELFKDLDYPTSWKTGLEYAIHPRVFLRTGFNLKPNATFFGTGFLIRKIQFDYALQYNTFQRLVHQGSIVYHLKGT
ncbi:MAG: hypothetical protein NZM13_05090 [Cyclobacteriaceae bacterium]|nr:hypothetical protein [Cyclobacteriaceae bacterium]MDW8332201.1 hypothetical protein [Cyclobacteriaceae bacterium]